MILLLGGTSETAPLATALARAGFSVLVSTATDFPLDVGDHPRISHRSGMLDTDGMARLVVESRVAAIVDASHPYASAVRENARHVCRRLGLPYLSWVRPTAIEADDFIEYAPDHQEAAVKAFSYGSPVLLTTGSRNLTPYVHEATRTGIRLVARVLPHEDSLLACRSAGIPDEDIITGLGPFSIEDNVEAIRRFAIGCLVTKDSGKAGGAPAKIEAARREGCRVVVVQRPAETLDPTFTSIPDLIDKLKSLRTPVHEQKQ